jgi:hypothetical protein
MFELEMLAKAKQRDIQREIEQSRFVDRSHSPLRLSISRISKGLIRLGMWLDRRTGETPSIPAANSATIKSSRA